MRHVGGSWRGTCLASVAAIALIGPASAQTQVEIVEGWIEQAEAFDWLEISHEGVSHDEASGTTTIEQLEFAFEFFDLPGDVSDEEPDSVDMRYGFTFPSLVFEGLDADGDYYVADRIRADELFIDFQIESEKQGASRTSGSYDGLTASTLRWARLPDIEEDPERPISGFYPLVAALVDVSFEVMEFGTLDMVSETSEPPMTTTVSYGAGTFGATERGNISSMSIDGVTVSGAADAGEDAASMDFDMTIGTIEASDYNYGDIVRLFDPELEPGTGDEPFETLNGWVSAADWTISTADVEVAIEDMRMEDLGGRRPTLPILARADDIYIAEMENGEEPDPVELVELIAATYGAFRVGLMEARAVAFDAEEYSGTLAAAGIAGLSSEGIESIHYRGLEVGDPQGDAEVRLGDFTISDLGFPSLAAIVAFEEAQEAGDVETIMQAIPTLGGILVSDLLVDVPTIAEISLARASLTMAGHIGPIPTRLATLIEDLRMPTWMIDEEESRQTIEALGYDEIAASHELDLAWEEASETIALTSSTTLEEGGTLDLNATLGGIPRGALENPMSLMFVAFGITLNEALVTFQDDSVTERALTMFAEQQGTDVATMRAQAVGILPFVIAALRRPDFLTMVTAAAGTFLENPGSLRIDMRPEEPVPLMQLMEASQSDPGLLVDLLNVEVSAE
ncbi:MAG: hypothetical protein MEQ84_12250 [Mesorhizobium sp.]|nr:hypothetical protein [Mesorhizobium sp.]